MGLILENDEATVTVEARSQSVIIYGPGDDPGSVEFSYPELRDLLRLIERALHEECGR